MNSFNVLVACAALLLTISNAAPTTSQHSLHAVKGFKRTDDGLELAVCVLELIPDDLDDEETEGRRRRAVERFGAEYLELEGITKAEFAVFGSIYPQYQDNDPNNDVFIQHYNPASEPSNVDGLQALIDAQSTWNDVSSSNFLFRLDSDDISRCPSLVNECAGNQYVDGNNDVGWLNLDSSSTLGVTWSVYGKEADVAINTDFDWSTSSSAPWGAFDLESVVLHELGHVIGLDHSSFSNAVMAPSIAPNTLSRTLSQDDINGITYLYPAPSTTQAPTTQAPTTQAPTTQAPTTQAPTTQAPTTQAPTTQAPTTQAPTTQAPTTQAPTTQAPTTQAPTTQAPTTQAPTTQAPTTQAPTTQAPTTQAPTTQAPTTQAPTTQAPTTQAPTTQAPTTTSSLPAMTVDAWSRSNRRKLDFRVRVKSGRTKIRRAKVTAAIYRYNRLYSVDTATTANNGVAKFIIRNPRAGFYSFYILDVEKDGYEYYNSALMSSSAFTANLE